MTEAQTRQYVGLVDALAPGKVKREVIRNRLGALVAAGRLLPEAAEAVENHVCERK
jgi:hypothetical protein